MVTIKASYQPNNKNHPIITITINNKKITLQPITKIQANVRLVEKTSYHHIGDIEKKLVASVK